MSMRLKSDISSFDVSGMMEPGNHSVDSKEFGSAAAIPASFLINHFANVKKQALQKLTGIEVSPEGIFWRDRNLTTKELIREFNAINSAHDLCLKTAQQVQINGLYTGAASITGGVFILVLGQFIKDTPAPESASYYKDLNVLGVALIAGGIYYIGHTKGNANDLQSKCDELRSVDDEYLKVLNEYVRGPYSSRFSELSLAKQAEFLDAAHHAKIATLMSRPHDGPIESMGTTQVLGTAVGIWALAASGSMALGEEAVREGALILAPAF